ncbi:MAG TPA: nickel-binding protein [Kofleriaceae bacterium]|nr:nickel-binding protein [Kofleriaceae bacterium]
MTTVVMEYAYEAPLTDDALGKFVALLRTCLEVREIAWQHAYLSLDRKTLICVYEARDASLVQRVHGMLDVPFARCHAMSVVPIE